jgi:hypothetical protein
MQLPNSEFTSGCPLDIYLRNKRLATRDAERNNVPEEPNEYKLMSRVALTSQLQNIEVRLSTLEEERTSYMFNSLHLVYPQNQTVTESPLSELNLKIELLHLEKAKAQEVYNDLVTRLSERDKEWAERNYSLPYELQSTLREMEENEKLDRALMLSQDIPVYHDIFKNLHDMT